MTTNNYQELFNREKCAEMLPPGRSDDFFEALFGDASEGSYDIELAYHGADESSLTFNILLHERPGHCLACNLTLGLPEVFSRHPIINVEGIVKEVDETLGEQAKTGSWRLGATRMQSQSLHLIPLTIELN